MTDHIVLTSKDLQKLRDQGYPIPSDDEIERALLDDSHFQEALKKPTYQKSLNNGQSN